MDDADAAARVFEQLLGAAPYKTEPVEREGVETLFLDAGGPKIELLASTDVDSPVAKFLDDRGAGMHHLAVEVGDIDAELVRVRNAGFRVLSDEPLDGADGKRIFFVHPRDCHGVLVEFCQQSRHSWRENEIEMPHGVVPAYSAGSTTATPVLLLHDQNSSARADFDALLPSLERSMHVLTFDAPGHGRARGWESGTSILRSADKHAWAVLRRFDVDQPAVVVGRGLGATAAVQMAVSYPEMVRGLALIDPAEPGEEIEPSGLATVPVLVCSVSRSSLENTLKVAQVLHGARLAVIPEVQGADSQLADLIAGIEAWS